MYSELALTNWDGIQFYCVICHVSLTSKSAWTLHVKGHHHGSSTASISATCYRNANSVEELIGKTIRLLKSQIKFVVRVGKENIFKFQCLLCLVELNGYFAVVEHLDDSGHRSLVDLVDLDDNASIMPDGNEEISAVEFSKTVKLLRKLYSGSLTCNRCSQKIELDEELIIGHEYWYHSYKTSSIVERFQDVADAEPNTVNGEAYPKTSFDMLKSQIEPLQSNSADLTVSSFQCENCDVLGPIEEWEPHVLRHHIKDWDLQFPDRLKNNLENENRDDIFCLCLQCECIFFGRRETITKHPHFGDRLPNDFPRLKATSFAKFFSKLHYYQVQRSSDAPYVAYCETCEYFAFEKLEKHFVSQEHCLKTNLIVDWYDCRVCRIVFFSERRLYDVHKLWPTHICAERRYKTSGGKMIAPLRHNIEIYDGTRWTETNEHMALMKRLLERIEGELRASYQFCNNFQRFAYFCGVCGVARDSKEDWLYHLHDEMHKANALRVVKPFENTCVSCKLCIFGGIKCHMEHSKTRGHKTIKRSMLTRWNEEHVRSRTELTENYSTDQRLSDMLYSILKLPNKSTSSSTEQKSCESCNASSKDKSAPTLPEFSQSTVGKTMSKLLTSELKLHQSTVGETCNTSKNISMSKMRIPQSIVEKPMSTLRSCSELKMRQSAIEETRKLSLKNIGTPVMQKCLQTTVDKITSFSSSKPKMRIQCAEEMLDASSEIISTSTGSKYSQSTAEHSETQFSSDVYSYNIDMCDDMMTVRKTIRAFLLESENRCRSGHLKRFHCSFCLKYYGKVDSWCEHLDEPKHLALINNYYKESARSMVTIFHCTGCDTITFGTTKSGHDYRKCLRLVEGDRRSLSRTSDDRSSVRSFSSSSTEIKTDFIDETEATSSISPSALKIQQTAVEQSIKLSSDDIYSCKINICDDSTKISNRINAFLHESERRHRKKRFKRLNCSFCNKSYGTVESWCRHLVNEKHMEVVKKYFKADPEAFATIFHCNECDALSFCQVVGECHHNTCSQWKPKNIREISNTNKDSFSTKSISSSLSSSSNFKTNIIDETKKINRIEIDNVPEVINDKEDSEDLEETMKNEELWEDASSISDRSEDERNEDDGERVNGDEVEYVKHLFVIRGIPADNLKNKKLIQNTFRKYGNVNRTYVKKTVSDTLFMVVTDEPEEMLQNLRENVDELKMKLNAEELTIENKIKDYSGPGTRKYLSEKAEMLFSNRGELYNAIMFLMKKYNEEATNPKSIVRVENLISVVQDLAIDMYDRQVFIKAYIFGSRFTGLASENSDVDIYLQIANSFRGATQDSSNLQRELVLYFASMMRTLPQTFSQVTSISLARVPIVKFRHLHSNLNCDLSFKSGLSTMNSILVRIYLGLDDRVKIIVCGVKLWMKLNEIASSNLFTTYAQIWLVLFFLMQPEIGVVPTVVALRRMLPANHQEFLIEGWNCAFPKAENIVWKSLCNIPTEELLYKFFEFYSNENLEKYVLCTMTGMKMEKKHFIQFYENLPKMWFGQFTSRMKFDRIARRRITNDFEGLCVQDPFDHAHNVTKTINGRRYRCFVEMCRKTAVILKK